MIFFLKKTIRINEKGEDEKTKLGKGESVKFEISCMYTLSLLHSRR